MLGELVLCLRIIFVQQCLQFHILEFFEVFHVPCLLSFLVWKSPLLKHRNHRSHLSYDGVRSPYSWSNRYDSATVLFKWKCCPRMLFVRYKFRHIEHNNTTLHTFFQFITRARLTLIDDTTKWRSVKSLWHRLLWCTICLKSAFRTCTPGTWRKPGEFSPFNRLSFQHCLFLAGFHWCKR